jgi:hypothetical protein
MRVLLSQLLALVFLAGAVVPGNIDPRYTATPVSPERPAIPNDRPPPITQKYPPSWYYNPYTQGIVSLPQRGGD